MVTNHSLAWYRCNCWAAIFSISPFSMSLKQSFSNIICHAAMNRLCVGVLWDQHTFGIRQWCKVGWKGSPANMFGRLYIDALWRRLQGNVAKFIPEQKNITQSDSTLSVVFMADSLVETNLNPAICWLILEIVLHVCLFTLFSHNSLCVDVHHLLLI